MPNTLEQVYSDAQQLHQAENLAQLIADCKTCHENALAVIYSEFNEGVAVEGLIIARSKFIDTLISSIWQFFFKQPQQGLSLVAVGGYGRQELLPHSDIDLLFLVTPESIKEHSETLEQIITFLWDIKLDIGHSVRTVDDCIEQASNDITIMTNLMESRTICGDANLLAELLPEITPENIWPSKDFFQAKWAEQKKRHEKFNNTEYNLEPNIKVCPGGLRDIQMIGWIAKRHFNVDRIFELAELGFLTDEEFEIMVNGHSFLLKLRFCLHMITGREEDRLLFENQISIAKILDYQDTEDGLAIEHLMKDYYCWAISLSELNDLIMQLFDEQILRACDAEDFLVINPRFRLRNQYLETANDKVFTSDPAALLELFSILANHDNINGVRASTIRQIRENRHLITEEFRQDSRNQQFFLDVIRSRRRVASTIKMMKRYGILGKYIPAFNKIIGLSQHDLFHIYSVDAHTILVLKWARRFSYEDMREKFPIANQVMKGIEKKELLYLACIFHDIAKGRGGDHSRLGANDAFEFCRQHGYNFRDSNLVAWLVKQHLLMSFTAQKKDLSDPDVIRDFALKVGDQFHLDLLFALTVADINGTNPELWNSWRSSLLRQLYYETKRMLHRGLENIIDKQDIIIDKQLAARELLLEANIDKKTTKLLWSNAGDDYFIRESAIDIAWHTTEIARNLNDNQPLVLLKSANDLIFSGATQLFIHTQDKKHVFAIVTGILEQHQLSIVDARIYSSNSGYTLDTFFIIDADGEPLEDDDPRFTLTQQDIIEQLSKPDDFSELINRRTPRQLKFFSIPTRAFISHIEDKDFSTLEVISADRPGLLATLGTIFAEFNLNLINAKIVTLGERIEDVFFISDENQQPITDPELCQTIEETICERLDQQVAETDQPQ
ncbi:MAG: [protein-PII] uridylyltransferase [Sinobacterium sp.]|nr:[protein-PII] uridylyltransferase [Sinobacterium sp.]